MDTVTVFVVASPGWMSRMVLRSVDEVLANIRIELQDMLAEEAAGLPRPSTCEFTIETAQYTQGQLDALPEWAG